jgi:hypothetical protein
MSEMNKMLARGAKNNALGDALVPTLPNPSEKEIARQHMLIMELFKRIDGLSAALVKLGAMPPPNVVNNLPEMSVTVEQPAITVEAPAVTVEAPTVNVAAPSVSVEAPNVNVAAPNVTVNPPQVHVSAPSVTMDAPQINVAGANVVMSPVYKWRLSHSYTDGALTETVAEAMLD